MKDMIFEKYHGLGNDYLVYDCNKNDSYLSPEHITKICSRNFGLGSDGILIGPIYDSGRPRVKIYNPDGSEAEKSGNGVRIFARYLKDADYVNTDEFELETLGGIVKVKFLNEQGSLMRVSMGRLSFYSDKIGAVGIGETAHNANLTFDGQQYKCTCVSIGNPHCVIPMNEISKEMVCYLGKHVESAPYFPNKINTQIVKIIDRNNIQIEIYERGAGYTLASGSSSCAAAGACYKSGLTDGNVCVHMPGGSLQIQITEDYDVFMTGSVSRIGKMILDNDVLNEKN